MATSMGRAVHFNPTSHFRICVNRSLAAPLPCHPSRAFRNVALKRPPAPLASPSRPSKAGFSVCAAAADTTTVKIIVQGLHMTVTDALRKHAEDKVSKAVSHFEGGVKEVDVKLSVRGGDRGTGPKQQRTEVTVYTLRNGIVRTEDVEDSMYASIDLVCDKLTRQLRKVKEKAINRGKWQGRGGPKDNRIADKLDQEEVVDNLPFDRQVKLPDEIVRSKTLYLKPMTLEDALEQLENVSHDFFMFRDKATDGIQVLYKRHTSGYGLIVPEYLDNES